MKKFITILAAVIISFCCIAQTPQRMSYQAVIRNAGNTLVTSHAVGMRISILQGSATGTAVYVETQTPTTNANGLVTIEIGGGAGFDVINWANGPYFIKTETDPTGGTTYTITGTSQILSVPYALYARTAESATDAVKTTGDQSIAGIKTFTGTINVNNNVIKNVANPSSSSDAATKAYVDVLLEEINYLKLISGVGSVTDIDGNTYKTIKIGTQVWMAEDLKTTKYKDGTTSIPNVTDNTAWINLTTPAYCWYNNNEASYKNTYGALYNWYTVNTGNLCPTGWHVPTDEEWHTLILFLDASAVLSNPESSIAGGKLKEIGTTHWYTPNEKNATNETGFTALPGGDRNRNGDGAFDYLGYISGWHSATENNATNAWGRLLHWDDSFVYRGTGWNKSRGSSVRCLKDN